MSDATKPPKKKPERAAWDAAARLNALGIKAIVDGPVVGVAGFRMHAPERTGSTWVIPYGMGGKAYALTAEATLDAALAGVARRAEDEAERLRTALDVQQKKINTCTTLRAKLAATTSEGDLK